MLDMFPSKDDIIKELREENKRLRATKLGTYCVVCDRKCKEYHRPMYASQAADLIRLYWVDRDQPSEKVFHANRFRRGKNDGGFALLQNWGLAISGVKAGFWGITEKGKQFVNRSLRVPKRVVMYNDEFLRFDLDETIDIDDALGEDFSYTELMSR